jgi:CHRD domain/Bacterial Ig domain
MTDKSRFKHALRRGLRLVIATGAAVLTACGGNGSGYTPMTSTVTTPTMTTAAPTVSLTSPGTTVNRTVTLTASPAAATGVTVTRVDFMVDGTVIGSAMTSPYSATWNTSTVTDGTHSLTAKVMDSAGMMATSTAVSVMVVNNPAFTLNLSPAQIYPLPASKASGSATLTVNLVTGAMSGKLMLSGITPTGALVAEGFAGSTGTTLVTLTANGTTSAEWDVPPGSLLTADVVTALLQGKLYVTVQSAAHPNGEIRGQILPSNVTVVWTALTGSAEPTPVTIAASGVAATTVDATANTVSIHINSTGVNDATAANLDTGAISAVGTLLVSLTKDSVKMGHWFTELAPLKSTDVTNFIAAGWYANVITPAEMNGAIRGQITIAPTLTQLQASMFTPICSTCHTGIGTVPPGALNMNAGHTFATLVGVPSGEQATVEFIAPGDPTNSYVIQKLEGVSTISGVRMPAGGPYLSQATINQVAAWISAGAQNN